jgi:hypothetical protein
MKYIYCLSRKKPSIQIVANVYPTETVLPEGFDVSAFQYHTEINTDDYPGYDDNFFGSPTNWPTRITQKNQ